MHPSSLAEMQKFKDKYTNPGKILDVGSLDVNGSYRDIFEGYDYLGFDIVPGKNVHVIDWEEIEECSFDYVISGQTLEHTQDDLELVKKIYNALEYGGTCCLIAPSAGPVHDYPKDYRRYQENDMIKLAEKAGLKVIECYKNEVVPWFDCVLIARKVEDEA